MLLIFELDMTMIAQASRIAEVFEDPARLEEMARYHKAMLDALNATHTNGEQDAVCVFEAVSHLLAQLIAVMPPDGRHGTLKYIAARAEVLHADYLAAGKAAEHRG